MTARPLPFDDDHHALWRPGDWLAAQDAVAPALAEAALAAGRLEGRLETMPEKARAGACRRLALTEVEAMLWAQGTPLARDEIGLDLMEARAGTDLDVMAQARWAVRRLEGQGDPSRLRDFLGLHRQDRPEGAGIRPARPTGTAFDDAAAFFLDAMAGLSGLHPLARTPAARLLWRLCDLSPPETGIEAAVWCARDMGSACRGAVFLPLGRHIGKGIPDRDGTPAGRMARHLTALARASAEACKHLDQVAAWSEAARRAAAHIRGDNPARIIAALAARPVLGTAMVEKDCAISRDTAERLLARMAEMGLIREITGAKRFRLWTARL